MARPTPAYERQGSVVRTKKGEPDLSGSPQQKTLAPMVPSGRYTQTLAKVTNLPKAQLQ